MWSAESLDASREGKGHMNGSEGLVGELLRPEDAGYEDARQIHEGMTQERPALIARCRATADISMAIRYARANGSEISVKGGGHNVAGRAVTEGGVIIDLSRMKAIDVDPEGMTARARAGQLRDRVSPSVFCPFAHAANRPKPKAPRSARKTRSRDDMGHHGSARDRRRTHRLRGERAAHFDQTNGTGPDAPAS